MAQAGRNAPCPCGSGKKYKKCCLPREETAAREAAWSTPSDAAVTLAQRWLERRYPEESRAALDEFFLCTHLEAEKLVALPPGLGQMVLNNAGEWQLAEGVLYLEDREAPIRELLLGPGGPLFGADERAWIAALVSRPLGLYEVEETRPGEGLRVSDLLHPGTPSLWVKERTASTTLARWDVLGARLVPWRGQWFLSGALYPFARDAEGAPVVDALRDELEREAAGDPEREREVLAVDIPGFWVSQILEPPAPPELVDVGSGDPILLVTDHYRVRDWARLEAVLAAQDDVEGDRRDGWTRFEEIDEDRRRSLLDLNPGRGDRLEGFARTLARADAGRRWLEEIAGDTLEHRAREMSDPKALLTSAEASERPPSRPLPAMTTEVMEQLLRSHYRTWADEKIPALDDLTPRQAVRTEAGRAQVIDVLKLYEHGEHRAALREGRDPVSFEFLWESVGLDRTKILARGAEERR